MDKLTRWSGRPLLPVAQEAQAALVARLTTNANPPEHQAQTVKSAPRIPNRPALRLSQALVRFNAQRYMPFAPRKKPFPKEKPGPAGRMLWHLYHDLGVLIFEGADDVQVAQIGRILEQVTANPGYIAPDHAPGLRGGRKDAKLRRYRLDSEHLVLADSWRVQEGELGLEGLFQATQAAFDKFAQDLASTAHGLGEQYDTISVVASKVKLERALYPRGLIHPTVNGPRRLPIDARVYIRLQEKRTALSIDFYTAGTALYLGSAEVQPVIIGKDPRRGRARVPSGIERRLFDEMQSQEVETKRTREDLVGELWKLEKDIWVDNLPEPPSKRTDAKEEVKELDTAAESTER